MPLLANHIVHTLGAYNPTTGEGAFVFEDIQGALQPKAEQLETILRPGVDGEMFRETGVRAEPSPIRTIHYVADRQAALDAVVAYLTLIDGNPYVIIQNGQNWGYFRFLRVINVHLAPVANVVGSFIPFPTIRHTVDFLVVSTEEP